MQEMLNVVQASASRNFEFPSPMLEMAVKELTPTVKPGLYHCVNHGCEYLFSEYSLVIMFAGKSYSATEFRYFPENRHVVAVAHTWSLDFYFSQDFCTIARGSAFNRKNATAFTFGDGPQDLLFKRREERQFQYCDSSPGGDPALYRLNDDHVALIVCEYTFVVLMMGDMHNSTSFAYNPKTRHVKARAHIWNFDFHFSKDFSYIEHGSYRTVTSSEVWEFGTAAGQLLFQRTVDGK